MTVEGGNMGQRGQAGCIFFLIIPWIYPPPRMQSWQRLRCFFAPVGVLEPKILIILVVTGILAGGVDPNHM